MPRRYFLSIFCNFNSYFKVTPTTLEFNDVTPEEILMVQTRIQAADRKSSVMKRKDRSKSTSRRERSKSRMKRLKKLATNDHNKTEHSVRARTAVELNPIVYHKTEKFQQRLSQVHTLSDVVEQSDTGSAISSSCREVISHFLLYMF